MIDAEKQRRLVDLTDSVCTMLRELGPPLAALVEKEAAVAEKLRGLDLRDRPNVRGTGTRTRKFKAHSGDSPSERSQKP